MVIFLLLILEDLVSVVEAEVMEEVLVLAVLVVVPDMMKNIQIIQILKVKELEVMAEVEEVVEYPKIVSLIYARESYLNKNSNHQDADNFHFLIFINIIDNNDA